MNGILIITIIINLVYYFNVDISNRTLSFIADSCSALNYTSDINSKLK